MEIKGNKNWLELLGFMGCCWVQIKGNKIWLVLLGNMGCCWVHLYIDFVTKMENICLFPFERAVPFKYNKVC